MSICYLARSKPTKRTFRRSMAPGMWLLSNIIFIRWPFWPFCQYFIYFASLLEISQDSPNDRPEITPYTKLHAYVLADQSWFGSTWLVIMHSIIPKSPEMKKLVWSKHAGNMEKWKPWIRRDSVGSMDFPWIFHGLPTESRRIQRFWSESPFLHVPRMLGPN